MKKEPKTRVVVKGTFEATLSAQEMLRKKIIELRDENRALADEDERSLFMRLVAHGTLGLGTNHIISIQIPNSGGTGIRECFEKTIRWAAKQTTNKVFIPHNLSKLFAKGEYNNQPNSDINIIWDVILDGCFSVFPLALDKAMSMSKERDERHGDDEYQVE